MFCGCGRDVNIQPPPSYYPSLAVERSDSLEIYQLYTMQFSGLDLSQKMLIYHLYRACVIGQDLGFDQDNEEFYISNSQFESSHDLVCILRSMITELELSIEFSDSETKKAIWAFIRFLQTGESELLTEYYEQLNATFDAEIIFCMGFYGTDNKPYSFNRLREEYSIPKLNSTQPNRPLLGLQDSFGGLILIADKSADSRLDSISKLYKKFDLIITKDVDFVIDEQYLKLYELICATGIYGPNFKKAEWFNPSTLFINSDLHKDILITNLSTIRDQEIIRQLSTDSTDSMYISLMEQNFIFYKKYDLLARIMPFGGSEVGGRGQPLITEISSLWCLGQPEFRGSDITSDNVNLTALYDVYLANLMSDILQIPEFGAAQFPTPAKLLIGAFLVFEGCVQIERTENGFFFKLINSGKMTIAINKLMVMAIDVMRDNLSDQLKYAPAKTIMPQRVVGWLNELNSQLWEIYGDVFRDRGSGYWRNNNRSMTYNFILPEPKLDRNKMGGITDVEMLHTFDFEGQMRRFSSLAASSP